MRILIDNVMQITDLLTALGVCVVLPVLIVWLVLRSRKHEVDRKTEILLKAIEAGIPIDENLLKNPKMPKSIKKDLMERFTGACVTTFMGIAFLALSLLPSDKGFGMFIGSAAPGAILLAIGIALFISYFCGRKMLAKEIEAEEKELNGKTQE